MDDAQTQIPSLIELPLGGDPDIDEYRIVPVLNRSEPTLAPSAYRLIQANRRVHDLQAVRRQAPNAWIGKHPTPRAPHGHDRPTDFGITLGDLPGPDLETRNEMALLASEALNHIRTALDYLAFNVVWKDRGSPHERSKFPLHTRPTGFGEERRKSLPGITPKHKEWIEAVQPFNGVEWTAALEELSNRDKHRVAVEVVEAYQFSVDRRKYFSDPLGDPDFRGFQVEEPNLAYLIADALQALPEKPHLEVERTLEVILTGAMTLLNRFLDDWGWSTMTMTREPFPPES